MEELPPAWTKEWSDMLKVRGRARSSAKRRGIQQAAPHREHEEARQTGSDLEPGRVEVLVRDAITCDMQHGPHAQRGDP